ncbi:MAG: membrane protein insertase YidC, partial [Streptosporangiaceae bacterium]
MSILNPINDAVAWVITQLFNLLYPVFGAASGVTWLLVIVILVVLIRLIMVPLFIKQMHTQRAMTALGPKMAELRKKHKGDKEKLNAETMKLYQEAGVNPLMGCLPLVLQMPIFFALFDVLRFIAEWHQGQTLKYGLSEFLISSAQHASIFGATISDKVLFTHGMNVSLEAKVVISIAVVISMTTTFLTVRQSQKRGMMPSAGDSSAMGQSQKLMMYVMPLFALTGLYWQFGLVLYWVTTNVWTLGQQFVLLRRYPVGAAAAEAGGNVPVARKPRSGLGLGGAATRSALSGGPGTGGKAGQKPAAGD